MKGFLQNKNASATIIGAKTHLHGTTLIAQKGILASFIGDGAGRSSQSAEKGLPNKFLRGFHHPPLSKRSSISARLFCASSI